MALQNSGTITLDQIGREYAGGKPYRLQDHYRGGARVPAKIPGNFTPGNPGTYIPGTSGGCNPSVNSFFSAVCNESGGTCRQYTENTQSGRFFLCDPNPTFGVGYYFGVTYKCGANGAGSICRDSWTSMDAATGGPGGSGKAYGVKCQKGDASSGNPPTFIPGNPPTGNPEEPINVNVPASGTIKLSNFYGGRKA